MIPHEREMVERLKDKPFALVSISADAKKETLIEFLATKHPDSTIGNLGNVAEWNRAIISRSEQDGRVLLVGGAGSQQVNHIADLSDF